MFLEHEVMIFQVCRYNWMCVEDPFSQQIWSHNYIDYKQMADPAWGILDTCPSPSLSGKASYNYRNISKNQAIS